MDVFRQIDKNQRLAVLIVMLLPIALFGVAQAPRAESAPLVSAPSDFGVTAKTVNTIVLTWQDNANNEEGFEIERRLAGVQEYEFVGGVGPGVTTYTDSGLTPATAYQYRITAYAQTIRSESLLSPITQTFPLPPTHPLAVKALPVSAESIIISWQDNATSETAYRIEQKQGDCNATTAWKMLAAKVANSTSHAVNRLTANQEYSYRIFAGNAGGRSEPSACVSALTGKFGTPPAPANLVAIATATSKVMLTWQDMSTGESFFRVHRKAGAEPWKVYADVAGETTRYIDTHAIGNSLSTRYLYRIAACNENGCSPYTSWAQIPLRPSSLTIAPLAEQINLAWADNGSAGGPYQILRRVNSCDAGNPLFTELSTTTKSSYIDSTLIDNTQYAYKVRAYAKSADRPYAYGYSLPTNCVSSGKTSAALQEIIVTPADLRLLPGNSRHYKAVGRFADNSTADLSALVTWHSSNNTIATFSGTAHNQVSAYATGRATITASLGVISGSVALEVSDVPQDNIILILTDDQELESVPFMPNLNSLLVSQGVTFANYFNTTGLCCPSRTSILRGQYVHNHQVFTNNSPEGGFSKFAALGLENSTVATWLHDHGYRTSLLGKFLNGYPSDDDPYHVPTGWDNWHGLIGKTYFRYRMNENGQIIYYGDRAEDYMTDMLAVQARLFIQQAAVDKVPFFLYLSPYAVHGSPVPAPRHQNEFANLNAPRKESFNEEDVSDKPLKIQDKPLLEDYNIATIDYYYRKRLQTLLAVDDMIAGVIDTLKATGQLDRTYIFFSSDNGYFFGEHRIKGDKRCPYDEAIHVPLIVSGPGVPAGMTFDNLAVNIDLAPTFSTISGSSTAQFVDGRSIDTIIHNEQPLIWRNSFLVEYWTDVDSAVNDSYQLIRTKRYKYVRRITGEVEFYDLEVDPHELNNLYGIVDPVLLEKFSSRLELLSACSGQQCRDIENLPLP